MTVFMSNGKPFDAYGTPVNAKTAAKTKTKSAGTDLSSDFPEHGLIATNKAETTNDDAGTDDDAGTNDDAGTDLPSDFPERDLIVGSEFRTLEALKNATDQELLDIDGIGPAKLKAIRAALK